MDDSQSHGITSSSDTSSGITPQKITPEVIATSLDPKTKEIKENLAQYEHLFGTDEDAYSQPTTTKKELWSYYLYYNGDNGVGPGSYAAALFQQAITGAGWDPAISPAEVGNCTTGGCVVPWGSGTRSVSSVRSWTDTIVTIVVQIVGP